MDIGEVERNNFFLQNGQFFTKGVEISGNMYFIVTVKGLHQQQLKKLLQRNDKKVTLLLIYHLFRAFNKSLENKKLDKIVTYLKFH